MGGRQEAQGFVWPAPIPTRTLSADDAEETHMDRSIIGVEASPPSNPTTDTEYSSVVQYSVISTP
jgi:hypothetical protein